MNWWVIWGWWRWVIRWTAWWWGWLLLSFLFTYFFQFCRNYTHFFYWFIVHIIPPLIFPIHWLVFIFNTKAKAIIPSFNLNTLSNTILFFTKTCPLFPAHTGHKFFSILRLKLSIWNTWWLKKSLSVFSRHELNQQYKKWL